MCNRRARLRISAPQSENSQHDILGPQIFNIDPGKHQTYI